MTSTFVSRMLFRGPQQAQTQQQQQQQSQNADLQGNPASNSIAEITSGKPFALRKRSPQTSSKASRSRSWPAKGKSSAVTEVARESISASNLSSVRSKPAIIASTLLPDQNITIPSVQSNERPGKLSLVHTTNCGVELVADRRDASISTKASSTTTKGQGAVLDDSEPQQNRFEEASSAVNAQRETADVNSQPTTTNVMNDCDDETLPQPQQTHQETQRTSWLEWFMQSRSPEMPVKTTTPTITPTNTPDNLSAGDSSLSNTTDSAEHTTMDEEIDKEAEEDPKVDTISSQEDAGSLTQHATSWLQKWKMSVFASPTPAEQEEQVNDESLVGQGSGPIASPDDSTDEAEDTAGDTTNHDAFAPEPNHWKSAWFFWSGDKPKEVTTQKKDTKSSNQPTREGESMPASDEQSQSPKKSLKAGPVALPPGVTPDKVANTKKPIADSRAKDDRTIDVLTPSCTPNQVLPNIRDTLKVQGRPRLLQQIGRLFMSSREEPSTHVSLTQDPPRIRKAVAIGVHGYFPVQILRKVLGPPTGTSIRFATMGAKAISDWVEEHGGHCDVTKIPLEGEGRIAERVDMLWNALLSFIDEIKNSDFVLVSCHSQGVPVATMLVSKLIDVGCIQPSRIGICAMAGVNLGPFADYRSRLIGGAAGELFEFANPASKVSQAYARAVEHVLTSGSKITYVGSIDDQLVPLESSVFSSISHPYIYRAVFVNGRVHAPSFLSNLFGFIMKLRNLGISDHGLIRELSSPVAGSLYSGEGHSRLYDDGAVYKLAIQFTLESLPVSHPRFERTYTPTPTNPNPYILPFIMRGVLEEDHVRREMTEETDELLKQFDSWRPSSKVLKDVKFRLEGIRSKL
ncbi:hypothetical protein KEM56_005766 [Ascosphaera pollenicola]|nr:hypothetical protein KEM56_005766 [Ascosphaera pollenicola]